MSGIDINLIQIVMFVIALVVSITFHEFAHAWSAYQLGDPTAKMQGRLTLNPIVHFDPLGAMMILFMAIARVGIGWGRPVPVNPYNMRGNPRVSLGLTSVSGPFSNLLLAAVAAIPLRLELGVPALLGLFLYILVFTNVMLAIFNLLPLPPLDGFAVVQGILGSIRTRWAREWGDRLDRLAPFGPMVLLGLLMLGWLGISNILWVILSAPRNLILGLLLG